MSQQDVITTLFGDENPYSGFNELRFRPDMQGWNSHHDFLTSTLDLVDPRIVIEVGVWKGGSSIHMAKTLQARGKAASLIAIDTWLGSWEHYEQSDYFPSLLMQNGYPTLYYTFLTNVVSCGLQNVIVPLPLDSANAFHVISRKNIRAQVIHIDAGHDYEAVMNDLRMWWQVLEPGGYIIADDYDSEGRVWPSVRNAVDAFLTTTPHESFEALPYKARFRKPRG